MMSGEDGSQMTEIGVGNRELMSAARERARVGRARSRRS